MTTNKKRPSDLAVWDGDLSANLHVHRPGSSMKVSLQEIVDAVPVPEPSPDESGTVALPGRFEIGSYVIGVPALNTTTDSAPLADSAGSIYRLVEGSGLRMASLNTYHPAANPQVGTWRQMSVATSGGTDYLARATIFMRIA
jgi:hypothetical protein